MTDNSQLYDSQKYETEITINNANGKVISRIKAGSIVLECGCSTGYMTHFMRDNLNAKVYVIEIDEEAFNKAKEFAIDGICANLEDLSWTEYFAGIAFDYIIFADVLEHLRNPKDVLCAASKLLKEGGKIVTSIPNVAHNDLLFALYNDQWNYTKTGLLDNTHIHFWGEKNIESLFSDAGLTITYRDCIYRRTFNTEQKSEFIQEQDGPLLSMLMKRPYGEVYQFIIEAAQTKFADGIVPVDMLAETMAVNNGAEFFFDNGNGFEESNVLKRCYEIATKGVLTASISLPNNVRAVRFDPTSSACCISEIQFISNKGLIYPTYSNATFEHNANTYFMHSDPSYVFSETEEQGIEWIAVFLKLRVLSLYEEKDCLIRNRNTIISENKLIESKLNAINEEIEALKVEKTQTTTALNEEIEALKVEKTQTTTALNEEIEALKVEKAQTTAVLNEEIEALRAEKAQTTAVLNEEIEALRAEKAQTTAVLNEEIEALKAEKAQTTAVLNEEIEALRAEKAQTTTALNEEIERQKAEKEYYFSLYNQVNAQYIDISQSQCWKMTAPLRKVLDVAKATAPGKLFFKLMWNLKHNGLNSTTKKINAYLRKKHKKIKKLPTLNSKKKDRSRLFADYILSFEKVYLPKKIKRIFRSDAKKVLMVSHEMYLSGAPVALLNFAEVLVSLEYQPIIVSPTDGLLSKEAERKGIPVVIIPEIFSPDFSARCGEIFDLVVANTIVTAPIVTEFSEKRTPVLWWIHEAEVSYIPEFLNRMPEVCPRNVSVFTVGSWAENRLRKYRPFYQTKNLLYSLPEPIIENDNSFPKFLPEVAKRKTIIAIIGTIETRKAQNILIEAALMLPEEQMKECFFVFVGKNWSQPIYDKVQQFCAEHSENAVYIEQLERNDINRLYSVITCLVCTSTDDPMPIVVSEAMQLSKFVICSENTGSARIIREYDCGVVYANNDIYELSIQLNKMLSGEYNLKEYGERARKAFEQTFSNKAFKENIVKILSKYENRTEMNVAHCYCSDTVSVVIPTYNAGDELKNLLDCLQAQKGVEHIELVIIDSGSKDNTVKTAKEYGAVVVEIPQESFSHSYARNLGAENAHGKYIIFMTQDAVPIGKYWISQLLQPILSGKAVAVSCKETPKPDCDLFGAVSIYIHSKYMGIIDSDRILKMPKKKDWDSIRKNGQLNDVTCAIEKEIFKKFRYRGDYAEDLDLGIRLIESGYCLALLSSVQVMHSHNRSAFYYLKRCLVDSFTLKKILPDIPVDNPSEQQISNRVISAVLIIDCCKKKISTEHQTVTELCDIFAQAIRESSNIISHYTKEQVYSALNSTELSDIDLNIFVRAIAKEYDEYQYDQTFSGHFEYLFNTLLKEYYYAMETTSLCAAQEEYFDYMEKTLGQLCGINLAYYAINNGDKENILTELIGEYRHGV